MNRTGLFSFILSFPVAALTTLSVADANDFPLTGTVELRALPR